MLEIIDPYRQSFLFFRWGFWSLLLFVASVWWGCAHAYGNWSDTVLNNVFVYLPNYLTHEFSHRIWCVFGWEWWCYASGNGMETLIPLVLCFVVLQMRGGTVFIAGATLLGSHHAVWGRHLRRRCARHATQANVFGYDE